MKQEKQLLLDEIKHHLDNHPSFVIVRYERLKANTANDFRREVSKIGGNIEFLRKRLLVKAAASSGIQLTRDALPGHIGVIIAGQDPVETTKAIFKFSQDNDKTIHVIGGHFEGQLLNEEQMKAYSMLPSKDEMRAQFLSTLEAPMSQTLAVMNALLTSVVYCLDNKSQEGTPVNNSETEVLVK
jgi:large subunit ribosomal protein L10